MTGADGEGPLMAGNIPRAEWARDVFERMIDGASWPASMPRAERIASIDAAWHAHILGERAKPDMADLPRRDRYMAEMRKATGPGAETYSTLAYAAMNVADRESGRGIMGELEREEAPELVGWRVRNGEAEKWKMLSAEAPDPSHLWRIVQPLVVAPRRRMRTAEQRAAEERARASREAFARRPDDPDWVPPAKDPLTPPPTTGSGAKPPPAGDVRALTEAIMALVQADAAKAVGSPDDREAKVDEIARLAATLKAGSFVNGRQFLDTVEAVEHALALRTEARRVVYGLV